MKFSWINQRVWLVSLVVILFLFENFGLAKYFYQVFSWVALPVQVVARQVVMRAEWPLFAVRKSVNAARKVQMLEGRYSEALAQLTSLKKLEAENQQLRALLENSDRKSRRVVVSGPIVSQSGPTVGVGANDGVVEGDLVFVEQTLVGRVRQVFPEYAQVDLIFQTDFQPVVVQTSEGYRGLVRGDGKRVILTEVLPEELPASESRIETVGQVGIERGLFVGQVGKLLSTSADTVQTYQIIQYVDFYQASLVEIYK